MIWIAGSTVGVGGTANFEFNNIPQNFTHLQLRVFGRSTLNATVDNLSMYFNNDTGSNYSTHYLSGSGAGSFGSSGFTSQPRFYIPSLYPAATTGQFASSIIDILDYSNTNKNKTVRILTGFDANGSGTIALVSGLWMSTAAITRFNAETSANIIAGSRFDLYGITTSSVTGA